MDLEIWTLLTSTTLGILSQVDQMTLNELRLKKKSLMAHELLTWQLNGRTTWAAQGDANTKYFHSIASGRRNHNAIWALKDDEDNLVEDEGSLKDLGIKHFSQIFKDDNQ